jgi:two-component system, LytTR family, sensor histidine kinase AlgZ
MTQPTSSGSLPPGAPSAAAPDGGRPDAAPHQSVFGSTVFGSTLFDPVQPAAVSASRSPMLFDVCHVGVVLRTVMLAGLLVGVGAMFGAPTFAGWLSLTALGAAVALPGVLLWLLAACTLKRVLDRLPLPAQWSAAIALGALGGAFGWALVAITGLGLLDERWYAPALAGAVVAALVFQWLRLRAQAQLPAETAAKLAELQSRIRPHFLFNTLNTALSLVRIDPPRAEIVLEDLAELFRVALTDSGESTTLAEEVELAQRYLAIEQVRFGERLQVSWELDDDAGTARVPPLLLQPLVENAVRHGVEPTPEGGIIRIRTRVKLGRAVVSIANTVPRQPSQPGNGIALRNVRERVRLMHDVAAQFDARLDGNVFRVQIVVPL